MSTASPSLRRGFSALLLIVLGACGPGAQTESADETSSALTAINNVVTLTATPNPWELKASWSDYSDESSYSLYANTDPNPGSPLTAGQGGVGAQLRPGWYVVAHLNANTTSYTFGSMFDTTVSVCAYGGSSSSDLQVDCHNSVRVRPTPMDYATMEDPRVRGLSPTHFRVKWNQSTNTVLSRATITPRDGAVSPVLNDPDQEILFEGLIPNKSYSIEVCVQSQQDIDRNLSTCKTVTTKTLPLTPLAVRSMDINGITDKAATLQFVHENLATTALRGFSLTVTELGGQDVIKKDISPKALGVQTYSIPLTGFKPFTNYLCSVQPYNGNTQGERTSLYFRTDTRIDVTSIGLSGNSVLFRLNATAPGIYKVQRRLLTSWVETGRVDLPSPQLVNLVLDGVTDQKDIRVAWTLGTAETSAIVTAIPLAAGTPELMSTKALTMVGGTPLKKMIAVFMPTVTGVDEYVIEGQLAPTNSWTTLHTTPKQTFTAGVRASYTVDTPFVYSSFRVCKRTMFKTLPSLQCSANISSAGMTRYSTTIKLTPNF